jgi:type IV secretion system protein VirB4
MAVEIKKRSEQKYHSDVEEFVPYASHFDEETLLTKNGELLQTIKVTGYNFETISEGGEARPLRELVREAIKNNLDTDKFAVWIHTIRREADISTGGSFKQKFSRDLNEKWIEKNGWRTEFINELYITIISEGETLSLKNPGVLINSLFVETELQIRKQGLSEALKKLNKVTAGALQSLEKFGAQKLRIFKRDGIYYSEITSFISKIMNLKEVDIPLAPADLSMVLPVNRANFQYNTVQIDTDTGKHFGAVFTVKESRELSLNEVDRFLQLPVNFIVSEMFSFVPKDEVLENFKDQKKIYDISGKKHLAEITGIQEMFDAGTKSPTDFIQNQVVITVVEGTVKEMQRAVSDVVEVLREMGIVFIREDMFMENNYWSMLPANFDFQNRQNYGLTRKAANFASLHNFTTGKLYDNLWGNAVAPFRAAGGNPYFFNFHEGKNGHTAIVGENNQDKRALLNFVVSQAQKFGGKTIYIEGAKNSQGFITAISGKYFENNLSAGSLASDEEEVVGINISAAEPLKILELLNNVEQKLNKEVPNIIILDEEICAIDDANFVAELEVKAEKLVDKNAVIIFMAGNYKERSGIFSNKLPALIRTKIFMPNTGADEGFLKVFGVDNKEAKAIKKLNQDSLEFLVKRSGNSTLIKFNIRNFRRSYSILGAGEAGMQTINEAISEAGAEPEKWLPVYYSKMKL